MASTLVVPLQLVMLGVDALLAMHARLRQEVTGVDTVPVAKCDTSTWGASLHCRCHLCGPTASLIPMPGTRTLNAF